MMLLFDHPSNLAVSDSTMEEYILMFQQFWKKNIYISVKKTIYEFYEANAHTHAEFKMFYVPCGRPDPCSTWFSCCFYMLNVHMQQAVTKCLSFQIWYTDLKSTLFNNVSNFSYFTVTLFY